MVGGVTTITNNTTTMLAKDQTRLRIEKMEAERQQRRINAACAKVRRAKQVEQNISQGNPGDVDFIGLVRQWREEHAGLATAHYKQDNDDQLLLKEDKICVCVRKRPLNTKELAKKEHDAVTCLHPTATVHSAKLRVDGISKYCDHNTFRFDHAFDEEARTEDVYRYTAQPLVSYVCGSKKGFIPRATVFAYGQTGSGEFFYKCVCSCVCVPSLSFHFILYSTQYHFCCGQARHIQWVEFKQWLPRISS